MARAKEVAKDLSRFLYQSRDRRDGRPISRHGLSQTQDKIDRRIAWFIQTPAGDRTPPVA